MEIPDWKLIFDSPVLKAEAKDGGFANETWEVQTQKGKYILKVTKNPPHPDRPFWDGLKTLFGLDVYKHILYRKVLADFIREHSPLRVPKVLYADRSREFLPNPFVIMEEIEGQLAEFDHSQNTERLAFQIGDHLGRLHHASFPYWGCFPDDPRYPPEAWPLKLASAMESMAEKWFRGNPDVQKNLPSFAAQARALTAPQQFALVLPDLRLSQFLMENGQITTLVDIESHVIGPRELDFINLEHWLPCKYIPAFLEGYEKHQPIPDLQPVRSLYRYLYYLIDVLAVKDYQEWMNQPILFGGEPENDCRATEKH